MEFDYQGIEIFDISFWQSIIRDEYGRLLPPEKQKHVDFERMKANAVASAVIVRAGQLNYSDYEFRRNWENAKIAGIPRASYWFCDRDNTPVSQAKFYWSLIKDDVGEGFVSADIEDGSWKDWDSWYVFINELQQISGLPDDKIFFYTNYYFWAEHAPYKLSQRQWFTKYPLWLAAYSNFPYYVKYPSEWEKVTLWQDGTPAIGLANGVWSKEIDHNKLNGGMQVFQKYFKTSATPVPTTIVYPYSVTMWGQTYVKEN